MHTFMQHEPAPAPATSVDVVGLWRQAVQGNARARIALLRRLMRRHDAPRQPLDAAPNREWAMERLAEVLAA